MTLEEFNKVYVYKSDNVKYLFGDVWEIPKPNSNGIYEADCESYCRFLKEKIEYFKDWSYYYCTLAEEGHCILIKQDKVIDCNCRRILNLDTYKNLYQIANIKKYSTFQIFSKIVVGKILALFPRKESNVE